MYNLFSNNVAGAKFLIEFIIKRFKIIHFDQPLFIFLLIYIFPATFSFQMPCYCYRQQFPVEFNHFSHIPNSKNTINILEETTLV